MDVTLDDLLSIEPRLTRASAAGMGAPDPHVVEAVELTWAVSARTTPPHLPVLRGGEIVVVPERVAAILGPDLSALLREARLRDISGVVVPNTVMERNADLIVPDGDGLQYFTWCEELTPEVETILNRHLTEHRGELYRVGSEFERRMADLAANHGGLAALVAVAAELSGLPVMVRGLGGNLLASSAAIDMAAVEGVADTASLEQPLPSRAVLSLGPFHPRQRAIARFLIARIAAGAEAAMRREDAARPRGSRRIEATAALLAPANRGSSEQRSAALALGLDPDALYVVAVSAGEEESAVARVLSLLGAVHPAGGTNGRRLTLVAANGRTPNDSLPSRVAEIKRKWDAEHADDGSTLAISAPSHGVVGLPGAAREARFVATLQTREGLTRRAASFESIDDVGALRLLYPFRESNELRSFVVEAIGPLERRDQRGTLRATLRAFLESGGSHVEASRRLGIHRNTLAYRLRRIGELVGRDVADPGSWLTLHIALRASEMLKAYADDNES